MKLILASASPRRSELLTQIGVKFLVKPVNIDETPLLEEHASDYVVRMAKEKALACYEIENANQAVAILGSDTSVIVDGDILGKPADFYEARDMLMRLSGREHQVMTSVCLVVPDASLSEAKGREPEICTQLVTTSVKFKELSEEQILAYWQSGEPCDKAGAYAIQGFGAVFVEAIQGSYSAVVGLPLAEVSEMLSSAGIAVWQTTELAG